MAQSPGWQIASKVEGIRGSGQDRVLTLQVGTAWLLVVADGAGGTAGGAAAAQLVCDDAQRLAPALCSSVDRVVEWLCTLDQSMRDGQTTVVAAVLSQHHVVGASIGDSQAWLFGASPYQLTEFQFRKPLLGTGEAIPVEFSRQLQPRDRLVMASDGIFNYVKRRELELQVTTATRSDTLCDTIIEGARLPLGMLQDDASVIVGLPPLAGS